MSEVKKGFINKLNLLKRSRFLPKNLLLDLYYKVILPSITYSLPIWGSASGSEQFECLEKIHTRAARIIYNFPRDLPSNEVHNKAGWHTLFTLYKVNLIKIMYKIYNSLAPQCMDDMALKCHKTRNLRSKGKHKVTTPRFKTLYMKNSIHNRGSILWNRTSDLYESSPNLKQLCKNIKKSKDFLNVDFKSLSEQTKPKKSDIYIYF
jgi:hypothetical protein